MAITKPLLPPKAGYVEVEINGVRKYRNVTTGEIFGQETIPTTDERIKSLESQLAQADEVVIDLYESQATQDEALIELYEMIGG